MKNKSLIIGAIVLSLVVILATGTYAYWTITKSQDGANTLIGGCLNVDITEESAGINLEKTWPISDFEGMQLEGYTFTVTNECEEPQDYRIDLDRLVDSEGRKEMSNEYLATLLDYGVPVMYEELSTGETTVEDVKEKRVLAYDTVMGKSSNEHTLRLWIDEESPVSEQGSTFLSRVEINAGQGIEKYYTPEECFTFDASAGSITAYDATCGGSDVVIPYNINNVVVAQIGANAFKEKDLTSVEFPRSIKTIGNTAFQWNPNIEKIIFKDGLTSIGAAAFLADSVAPIDKSELSFISFPKTLTNIGSSSFANNNLTQIIIPDNITTIGGSAFKSNLIKDLKIGLGITKLQGNTFFHNELEKVIIPNNILSIGSQDFALNPLKSIVFGSQLTLIRGYSFSNNISCLEYSYERICYNSQNFLSKVYIPANVTKIEADAFESLTSDAIITVANSESAMSLGSNWSGAAKVIFGGESAVITE